jgi:hypothetical protein
MGRQTNGKMVGRHSVNKARLTLAGWLDEEQAFLADLKRLKGVPRRR